MNLWTEAVAFRIRVVRFRVKGFRSLDMNCQEGCSTARRPFKTLFHSSEMTVMHKCIRIIKLESWTKRGCANERQRAPREKEYSRERSSACATQNRLFSFLRTQRAQRIYRDFWWWRCISSEDSMSVRRRLTAQCRRSPLKRRHEPSCLHSWEVRMIVRDFHGYDLSL